ncbi:hypothetical protein [Shewanella vesiculosa]|uniref:hypothetical protein n=1 Tax=Shewanella vesiculosa TaxID=518738 RepID=UPI00384B14AE
MTISNDSKPDVLRVTEYILQQNKLKQEFSVQSANTSEELNGIGRHRIAQIMRDICLDPEGEGSLVRYTTVDNTDMDNNFCRWQLNAHTYFSYLSYLSVKESEKSNNIAIKTLRVAIAAICISIITAVIAA